MFNPDAYISALLPLLQESFGSRLRYVGLQGSYLRGEATQTSDIDIMAVVEDLSPADLAAYRTAIQALEGADLSCGFICGLDELKNWNRLEMCHLLHTTRDYFGCLKDLIPAYTEEDVRAFVQMSLGNLYHELCHRFIHSSRERNEEALPFTFKSVFFILQNLHYLETGHFLPTKKALLAALTGPDRQVLERALSLTSGGAYDFDDSFSLLFSWCRDALARAERLP